MPIYIYRCDGCGETTTKLWQSVEDAIIPCPYCGDSARRQEVYTDQYTRTESGGMQGRMGRVDDLSEGAERIARNSEEIEKTTGQKSGPRLR